MKESNDRDRSREAERVRVCVLYVEEKKNIHIASEFSVWIREKLLPQFSHKNSLYI